jgi:hypothetical protein
MIPGSSNPLLLASAATAGVQIERSLRFNSIDSGHCSRTANTPTASGTWTFSVWVKRSKLGSDTAIFGGRVGTLTATQIYFKTDNTLRWFENTADFSTTAVFRDVSAWYNFVFVKNGTTSCTIYVNGTQIQQTTTSVPATSPFNTSAADIFIGAIGLLPSGTGFYGDHYLTNIHFIDGQALTPSSFTETDATTGQLIPKTYTGSYGTNGFNLLFADNSSNTASTLGKDTSGNSNNWTPNNLSVTAGAGNDSLVDSPTNYGTDTYVGGEVRGNYATLNPLDKAVDVTLTNGNLDISHSGSSNLRAARATIKLTTGKWYCEAVRTTGTDCHSGIITGSSSLFQFASTSVFYGEDGKLYVDGSVATNYGITIAINDVVGIAVDMDAAKIYFYKNGTLINTGGTSFTTTGNDWFFKIGTYFSGSINTVNFGQRAFAYTAPSGFKALCTQNLPEGTIITSGTYTGNGAADGPFVYLNGVPTAMTVGVNAVTFGTDADKLSNGFKLQTTNVLYNQNALSYSYSITTTGAKFKYARAQPNP